MRRIVRPFMATGSYTVEICMVGLLRLS
jgi:hypothetical protein